MPADFHLFLGSVAVISLSGVLSPGPITATAIAHGARERSAGVFISLGHGAVELPLIVLLSFGAKGIFESEWVRVLVGVGGGAVLIMMGIGMMKPKPLSTEGPSATQRESFVAGTVLSATNPYFLLWWASVGLGLLLGAERFGTVGIAAFAGVHWTCDIAWLCLLSYMTSHGVRAFGAGFYQKVSIVCGSAIIVFGGVFIFNAIRLMLET